MPATMGPPVLVVGVSVTFSQVATPGFTVTFAKKGWYPEAVTSIDTAPGVSLRSNDPLVVVTITAPIQMDAELGDTLPRTDPSGMEKVTETDWSDPARVRAPVPGEAV